MNNPEQEKGLNPLEKIKDLANSAANSLTSVPFKKIAVYGSTAVIGAFSANEIASTNQAEARIPIDSEDNMAMVGTVTVKETVTKEDGDKDTTIQVSKNSRGKTKKTFYDGYEAAMKNSKEYRTIIQKATCDDPVTVKYRIPFVLDYNKPTPIRTTLKYDPRVCYDLPGIKRSKSPSYSRVFKKEPYTINNIALSEKYTTGTFEGDSVYAEEELNGKKNPLRDTSRYKGSIKLKPKKSKTITLSANLDQCFRWPTPNTPGEARDLEAYTGFDKKPDAYECTPATLSLSYKGFIRSKGYRLKGSSKSVKWYSSAPGGLSIGRIKIDSPPPIDVAEPSSPAAITSPTGETGPTGPTA